MGHPNSTLSSFTKAESFSPHLTIMRTNRYSLFQPSITYLGICIQKLQLVSVDVLNKEEGDVVWGESSCFFFVKLQSAVCLWFMYLMWLAGERMGHWLES